MKRKSKDDIEFAIFCKRRQSCITPENAPSTIENPEIASMQTLQKIFNANNPLSALKMQHMPHQ